MQTLQAAIAKARQSGNAETLVKNIPYARFIGMQAHCFGETWLYEMPYGKHIQGNPSLPAVHGGVIGGFMETAALVHCLTQLEGPGFPKVVDFSIDYLRAALSKPTFAECSIVRQGRKIVNVSVHAWQTTKQEPVATARTHFLLSEPVQE
ncbi:MAG: PaaI family thioesterase [Gammaproteobacteria bacterium]|nr:MAG: PaaI family thioesterase [Gammaproteobacteria bacterium]